MEEYEIVWKLIKSWYDRTIKEKEDVPPSRVRFILSECNRIIHIYKKEKDVLEKELEETSSWTYSKKSILIGRLHCAKERFPSLIEMKFNLGILLAENSYKQEDVDSEE